VSDTAPEDWTDNDIKEIIRAQREARIRFTSGGKAVKEKPKAADTSALEEEFALPKAPVANIRRKL